MKQLTEQFLDELQVRNYSSRTIDDYRYHLQLWRRFLRECKVHELAHVSETTVADFQRWLYYQPTRRGTVRGVLNQNTVLAAIKSFFRFLKAEGQLVRDPAATLEYARQPKCLPRNVLTPTEASRILDAVDASTPIGKRDRAILEIFYATGIRKEELRALRLENLNLDEGLLRITLGKGGRDRVVPLGTMAIVALRAYLRLGRPELLGSSVTDQLFLSYRGHPIDPHTLGTLVKQHARRAGIKKPVTPHIWRHTCATHVQDLLGHQSLTTTERYLRLTITDLKEAHAKYHPREQQQTQP